MTRLVGLAEMAEMLGVSRTTFREHYLPAIDRENKKLSVKNKLYVCGKGKTLHRKFHPDRIMELGNLVFTRREPQKGIGTIVGLDGDRAQVFFPSQKKKTRHQIKVLKEVEEGTIVTHVTDKTIGKIVEVCTPEPKTFTVIWNDGTESVLAPEMVVRFRF